MTEKPMPEKGDRVRVVQEGTITTVVGGVIYLAADSRESEICPESVVSIEILPPPLPEEPPVGSVVLDRDGDAWQRDGDEWRWRSNRRSWATLNGAHYGPLRIIHRGGES